MSLSEHTHLASQQQKRLPPVCSTVACLPHCLPHCLYLPQVQKSEQELRNVQVEEQNRAFAFGGQTAVRVLQLIDQNIGRFRNRPIGPLGREMDLLDPQ